MASQTFEEVLRFVVQSGGTEDVQLLLKQLDSLEAVSKEGSAQVLALVEKLKLLAAQSAQIQSYTRLKGEIAETATAIEKESAKLVALRAEMDAAEKPAAALERAYAKQQGTLDKLLARQNVQSVELQKTAGALTKAGVDTDKLSTAQAKLNAQMGATQAELGKTSQHADKAGESVQKFGEHSESAVGELKKLALRLTEVALVVETAKQAFETVSEFVGDSVESAAQYDEAMTQAAAVTGATTEQIEAMRAATEEAARTTRYTSNESAQALVALARASGDATQAAQELVPTLHLAAAAGIETADAATKMVQTLADFGLGAEKASHVADLLAKGAQAGGLGLDGMADALAKTAPAARAAGLDVDQTVAVIAALAREGVRGRQSAGALRAAFVEMSDPASEFSARLDMLGIKTHDFAGMMRELSKRGEEGRLALTSLSAEARPALELLLNDGGAKVQQLSGELAHAGGAAKEMADKLEDSYDGATRAIAKSWEELKESLFEPVLVPLKNAIRDLADQLDAFARSKDFEEIKVALKDAFEEGGKAAIELFKTIDFHALAQSIKAFAGDAKGSLTEFRNNLSGIIGTLKVVYQAFAFTFHAIESAVLLTAAAITDLLSLLVKMQIKLQELNEYTPQGFLEKKLGIGQESLRNLREMAAGLDGVSEAYKERLGNALGATAADFDQFTIAANDAAAATDRAATSAGNAHPVIHLIRDAGLAASEGTDAAAASAQKLAPAHDSARVSADQLTEALAKLGIVSKDKLHDVAEATETNLRIVVAAYHQHLAAIDDVRAAFAKWASDKRAEVANSDAWRKSEVENQVAVKAAMLGIVSAGKAAGDAVVDGAQRASRALRDEADAGEEAGSSLDRVGDAAEKGAKKVEHIARGMDDATVSMGGMSEAAAKAFQSLNRPEATSEESRMWMQDYNRLSAEFTRQQKDMARALDETDRKLADFDPLAARLKDLQRQYPWLDPAALRTLAEKQQQLVDAQKRADEEQQRSAQETARAATNSGAGAGGPAHALTNPNVSARSTGTQSRHVIELQLPKNTDFTDEQIQRLTELIGAYLAREMSTMTGHRFFG